MSLNGTVVGRTDVLRHWRNGRWWSFLHGVLTNGSLWDPIVNQLRGRYRCMVSELPFGAHRAPMPDDSDLDLASLAKLIADFLDELDLGDGTLVRNDWEESQLIIAPGGSDRVSGLVLVSCEAP